MPDDDEDAKTPASELGRVRPLKAPEGGHGRRPDDAFFFGASSTGINPAQCRQCGKPLPGAYQLGINNEPIGCHRFEARMSLLVSCGTCGLWSLIQLNEHGCRTV
jgi:hypothetical protein